jgi:hypothetical protein
MKDQPRPTQTFEIPEDIYNRYVRIRKILVASGEDKRVYTPEEREEALQLHLDIFYLKRCERLREKTETMPGFCGRYNPDIHGPQPALPGYVRVSHPVLITPEYKLPRNDEDVQ